VVSERRPKHPGTVSLTAGGSGKLTFTMDGYNDVWLPNAEYPSMLDFDRHTGGRSHYDSAVSIRWTGTTANSRRSHQGIWNTGRLLLPSIPSDKDLGKTRGNLEMPPVTNVPDVAAAAEEYAVPRRPQSSNWRNIERSLKTVGYSVNTDSRPDPVPRAGGGPGRDRMSELFLLEPMVGDEEQYTSALRLWRATLGGIRPASSWVSDPKVTSGNSRPSSRERTTGCGNEVAFKGVGWVLVLSDPDQDGCPQALTTKPKIELQPRCDSRRHPTRSRDEVPHPGQDKRQEPESYSRALWSRGGYAGGLGSDRYALLAVIVPWSTVAALLKRRA
jgi:hypothetical protein